MLDRVSGLVAGDSDGREAASRKNFVRKSQLSGDRIVVVGKKSVRPFNLHIVDSGILQQSGCSLCAGHA